MQALRFLLLACVVSPGVLAQGTPPGAYVARGACPFECCRYGAWTATEPVPVYAAEGEAGPVTFTLAPGARFEAVTGNVHVDPVGVVVVVRPGEAYGEGGALPLAPGDTLYVLDYLGEGFFHVALGGGALRGAALGGAVLQAEAWWVGPEASEAGGEGPLGVILREPRMVWWVEVRTRDGRTGWVRMGEAAVEGADGCG